MGNNRVSCNLLYLHRGVLVGDEMTEHMLKTLRKLAEADTRQSPGWHFGTLKALVKRGFAETFRGAYGTEYRITQAGREQCTR